MRDKQKTVITILIGVVVAMLMFPPFQFRVQNGVVLNLGYGFIFNPPLVNAAAEGSVNIGMLVVQWLGVIIVGGLILFMLKEEK